MLQRFTLSAQESGAKSFVELTRFFSAIATMTV